MNLQRVIEVLEDLKSEDVKKRVSSLKNIDKIVEMMGVEKTKQQLLPFLKEYEDEEEEVMLELANQFKVIAQFINDSSNGVLELIPYYYLLLGYEDFTVVSEGFKSLEWAVKTFDITHESVFNLVKKLQSMNTIKSLSSASRVCAQFYKAIPAKYTAEAGRLLTENASSRHCLVRRSTASCLEHLLDEDNALEPTAAGLLKKLLKDPQESVKMGAVEALSARSFTKSYFMSNWHVLLTAQFDSRNWKIRSIIAKNLQNVFSSMSESAQKATMPLFLKLISDPEQEVAMQAIESLRGVSEMMEPGSINEKFFQITKPLLTHEDVEVKKLLAASLPEVAPLCSSESVQDQFNEMAQTLLKDESSEVRVGLLSNLGPLAKVYSNQQLVNTFLPPMMEMLGDKNWKVRRDALVALQSVAKGVGEGFVSNEKILKALRERLADRVFEVRRVTLRTIKKICETTTEWPMKHGLPLIGPFAAVPNYLYRVNYLWALNEMAPHLPPSVLLKEAETVAKLAKDGVANIRYQACITLFKLHKQLGEPKLEEKIVQVLKELESDSDSDIQRMMNKQAGSSFRNVYNRLIEQRAV